MTSLQNHIALVTGNSTGLGKAIGLALGRAGAKIPINFFNNESRAKKTLAEYEQAGIATCLIKSDVTTDAGVELLIAETEKRLGPPDIIVPNATCDQPLRPIEDYDWAFYQSMLDFFVKSPYLLSR